ncbi:MAG: hypothetical protein JWQ07_4087 [Ramlibacter sp.]|nr:hypothetical protein [Ramlibacter sp.]
MQVPLASRAASALIQAMHARACLPEAVYLDVPAPWHLSGPRAAEIHAAARDFGPFAMRQNARRFALRFVNGLVDPVLVVHWRGMPRASLVGIP